MEKIKIFVSYSHEDEEWVSSTIPGTYKLIPWLERQLKSTAEIWTDHSLKELPGERYNQLITEKILDADIALLLISQDFVSSEYIMGTELPLIKHQYDDEKIKIIPLLITNVSTEGKEKISWIFDLQTYPNDTKPLIFFIKDAAEWSNVKVEILNGINNKINSIRKLPETIPPPVIIEVPVTKEEKLTHPEANISESKLPETAEYQVFVEILSAIDEELTQSEKDIPENNEVAKDEIIEITDLKEEQRRIEYKSNLIAESNEKDKKDEQFILVEPTKKKIMKRVKVILNQLSNCLQF